MQLNMKCTKVGANGQVELRAGSTSQPPNVTVNGDSELVFRAPDSDVQFLEGNTYTITITPQA